MPSVRRKYDIVSLQSANRAKCFEKTRYLKCRVCNSAIMYVLPTIEYVSMSLEKKVVSGAKWGAFGTWSSKAVSFLVFVIISRNVTPESLGIVALATIYVGFIELLARQGIGMAIVRKKELSQGYLNAAYLLNIASAFFLLCLSILFAGLISDLMGDERLEIIIPVLAVALPINAMTIVAVALQTKELQFKTIAMQNLTASVISALVAVPMAIMGFEVWALVAQTLISASAYVVILTINSVWRPGFKCSKSDLTELISFSYKVLLTNIVGYFRLRMDQIFVVMVVGTTGLSMYTVALRITTTLQSIILSPLERAFLPAFAKMQGELARLSAALEKAALAISMVASPVFIGMAVLAYELILLAFGESWIDAAPVCSILSLVVLCRVIFFFLHPVFIAEGRPGVYAWVMFAYAVAMVPAAYFGGRLWGASGVALGALVSTFLVSAASTVVMKRMIAVELDGVFRSLLGPLICASIMGGGLVLVGRLGLALFDIAIVKIIIFVPLGAVLYVLALRVLYPKVMAEGIRLIRSSIAHKKPG